MFKLRFAMASVGLLLAACGGGSHASKQYSFAGVAQKGPFALGTSVHIAELDDALTPTGRSFDTTITDDTGAFSLPNVTLASPYVALTADGFYFDEVAGALSTSRIQLGALADMTSASSVNANLLSHLEQGRVKKLIADGKSFGDAKAQAQAELLEVFGITKTVAAAESLNIANGSDDDAILLAVSAIIQARRTPAELTELCAQLSADLTADGTVSDALGLKLAVGAELVDTAAVRTNLAARYKALGATATIGNFESLVANFIATTTFIPAGDITYPATGAGDNINLLASSVTSIATVGGYYHISLTANVPAGKYVRINISTTGFLYLAPSDSEGGWISTMTAGEKGYEIVAEPSETTSLRDAYISNTLEAGGDAKTIVIQVFENGATTPTFEKTITAQ